MTSHISFANPLLSIWPKVESSATFQGESCISDQGVAEFHLKMGFIPLKFAIP
eukprot:CAMPEP_0178727080 /NCGR_PEP_ID=MMETSP0699-20121125/27670_1 /TAXON_ID=265572 /ORGANISM="Extubocellulus spinifer, Strain CCMP396" /LENGTH=52 /DNA_ID=CAMNT_0020378765 /DNA_START=282 /DNA_END=440 /DNA_ORIENTATION=-